MKKKDVLENVREFYVAVFVDFIKEYNLLYLNNYNLDKIINNNIYIVIKFKFLNYK